MAWELKIHIIDVGQGESSLIIAKDPAAAPPNNYRSMLIDGGLAEMAETVHDYVVAQNQGTPLDHIVTTHYDRDHSGGITALLIADNRHVQNQILASAAGEAAYLAATSPQHNGVLNQISAAAAAVMAASLGAYDDEAGNDLSIEAEAAGESGQGLPVAGLTVFEAAEAGASEGEDFINNYQYALHRSLIPTKAKQKRRDVAIQAGIAAGTAGGAASVREAAAYMMIHNELINTSLDGSRFLTNGLYHDVNIFDVGDGEIQSPSKYAAAIDGSFSYAQNHQITVPNTIRNRVTPALRNEILWNMGNGAIPAPPGAPAVYVVALNRHVQREPVGTAPFVGNPQNRVSMGLIIRFNNFFYFTGGDLPFEGEDRMLAYLLGQANVPNMANNTPNLVAALGLTNPNPPPPNFPVPDHICCFKCSHHGSHESTSDYFVNNISAGVAIISAGTNDSYAHPHQRVIDTLHNSAIIGRFYLTNCHYPRNYVPGYDPTINQITSPGNKSRIAGDNNQDTLTVGRRRGDITIFVSENESLSATHPPGPPPAVGAVHHGFRIRYWDEDRPGGAGYHLVGHPH